MKPTETDRLVLRNRLLEVLGEPSATILMEAMPLVDYDRLATKDDLEHHRQLLDSRITAETALIRAELHSEIGTLRSELHTEIGSLRNEITGIHGEIGSLRNDITGIHGEIGSLRNDITGIHGEIGGLRNEIGSLRNELHSEFAKVITRMDKVDASMVHLTGVVERKLATNLRATLAIQIATMVSLVGLILGFA